MTNEINIIGQIGSFDGVAGVTLADIVAQYDEKADNIVLNIDSVGGDVDEGFSIYDFLISTDKPITAKIVGVCYSIATVIAMAGQKREIVKNGRFMIHNPFGMIQGEADEIAIYAEYVKRAERRLEVFYSKHINLSVSKISDLMHKEMYLTPVEAKEIGFITDIIDESKTVNQSKAVAYFSKLNFKKMTLDKEQMSWFEKQLNRIAALVQKNVKAMFELSLEDGNKVYVDSEDGELEGKSIFTDEALTTPAADGTHTLIDGRVITVENGVITSVALQNMEDEDELKAVKAENEVLKEKLKELENSVSASAKALATKEADFKEVQKELLSIQNLIFGKQTPNTRPNPSQSAVVGNHKTDAEAVLNYFKVKQSKN